jgi:cobalt-zinc-cadmium efflux system outer membrane protein
MLRQIASTVSILVVFGFAAVVAEQTGPRQSRVSGQLPQAPAGQRLTEAGPPLTLDAALTEALANNPELIALRRQFEATRERPAQERFLAAPTLEAQIWQWPINTLNPTNTNMYMFMFGQDIPGPGKRRLREAVVQKDVELAATDITVRARHVVDQVKRAYAALFLARTAIEIHHASVDLLRQLADVAQAKYTAGRISQQDVLKAVVELSRVHDHLITLDEQAQIAEAQLNTLLDRSAGALIGPLADPHERLLLPSADTLQQLAVQHQPELTMARLGAERADAQLEVVNREYKPDFFATGGYMLMPNDRDAWMAKVGVTWPTAPWSRGRLDAQRAEATAEIAAAKARVRAVENALRLAVQQAYVRVKSAEQRAALLRTTIVPQSEQTLEVSRVAYQTDRVDFLALIDNERVRLDARLDYYRALSDLEQALADLERAVGTDIAPSMLAAVNAQGVQ